MFSQFSPILAKETLEFFDKNKVEELTLNACVLERILKTLAHFGVCISALLSRNLTHELSHESAHENADFREKLEGNN